jgi:hypothetical protein
VQTLHPNYSISGGEYSIGVGELSYDFWFRRGIGNGGIENAELRIENSQLRLFNTSPNL